MAENLILLLVAALVLMGSPGPATLSLTAIGAAFGRLAGLPYLMGIIAGTVCVLLTVASGLTGLLLARPGLAAAVAIAAGAYILYLAFRIATAPPLAGRSNDAKPPAFAGGFVLAIANPKAFAAIGAVYAGHRLAADNAWADAGFKIAALTVVIIVVNTAWLLLGALLSRILMEPTAARIANILFAILLVLSVGLSLWSP